MDLSLSKSSLEALYSAAYQYLTIGNYSESEKLLYTVVLFGSKNIKYWKALAFVQQKQKKFNEACATYAIISTLNPNDPEPYLRAAECFFCNGDIPMGLEGLKEAGARIEYAPEHKLALSRMKEAWARKPMRKTDEN